LLYSFHLSTPAAKKAAYLTDEIEDFASITLDTPFTGLLTIPSTIACLRG